MQHIGFFTLLFIVFFGLISCASKAQEQDSVMYDVSKQNILIVYLSRTGNTEAVAKIIHEEVGGDMVELKLETPYPEDYDAIVAQVVREDEAGYRPPLKTKIDSIEKYDVVFVGFPTWNMQLPPPIRSFLNDYDLSGKTVIPFNTNGGYGLGSSIQQIEERYAGCNIPDAFSTKGGSETDGIYLAIKGERRDQVQAEVARWLQSIGIR